MEDSLYTGFCPEDLESEAEFTYCECNTNTPDTCSDNAIIQNCAPALKTKRGKKRGNNLTFIYYFVILCTNKIGMEGVYKKINRN